MKRRFLALAGAFVLLTMAFQNCGLSQTAEEMRELGSLEALNPLQAPGTSGTGSSMSTTGTGNGDGYGGKLGVYVAFDLTGSCGPKGGAPIVRHQVRITPEGVFQEVLNCKALSPAVRVPDEDIYFAESSKVVVVNGVLYIKPSARSLKIHLAHSGYSYHFCTNRWKNSPRQGLELRMVRRTDNPALYRAQIFIKEDVNGRPLIQTAAFVSVRLSLDPRAYWAQHEATGKGFVLAHLAPEHLVTGKVENRFGFRMSYEHEPVDLSDVRCWSSLVDDEEP